MRALCLVPLLALFVACAPQDVPQASQRAQFADYPKKLFQAFETDCAGPGEDYVKSGKDAVECRALLSPEATAFLILSFDGYPQDLPRIVTRLSSTKNQSGYLVDADTFFLVPQKTGETLRIPVESETLDRDFSRLYTSFGGTPV